jgi:hypothetical protein
METRQTASRISARIGINRLTRRIDALTGACNGGPRRVFRIIAESAAKETDLMEGLRRVQRATDADLVIVRRIVAPSDQFEAGNTCPVT